ncbi:MAG: NAD(P)H dehydrogenase assembly family protein [Cyanobium sp.]
MAASSGEPAPPDTAAATQPSPSGAPLGLGDRVVLARTVPYLKTADPMPMLRPPDLVDVGEVGEVREIRAAGSLAVRFRRGTFLVEAGDLRVAG